MSDDIDCCMRNTRPRRSGRKSKVSGNRRPFYWLVASSVFAMSALGCMTLSTESFTLRYEQSWVNESLESRQPFGDGYIQAEHPFADFSHGDFRVSMVVADQSVGIPAHVVGRPTYNNGDILAKNSETTVGKPMKRDQALSDQWADASPELISGFVRTVLSPADAWAYQMVENRAFSFAHTIPVVSVPEYDRARIAAGSIDSISIVNGGLEIRVDDAQWTKGAIVSVMGIILSFFGLLTLWLNRDFGKM